MKEEIVREEEVVKDDDSMFFSPMYVRQTKKRVGRPRKTSGIYYNKQVLISDRLLKLIEQKKLPKESYGCTLERLVMRGEAAKEFQEAEKKLWSTTWKEVDDKNKVEKLLT